MSELVSDVSETVDVSGSASPGPKNDKRGFLLAFALSLSSCDQRLIQDFLDWDN